MCSDTSRLDLLPANALTGKQLAISASNSPDLDRLGLLDTHFRMTLGELTRTVIIAGGSLFYGGHLESNGITRFLIEELHRYGRRDRPLKVCLAWTVHRAMSAEQIAEQKNHLALFGEIHFLSIDGKRLTEPVNAPPKDIFSDKDRAQALSSLRDYITTNTTARIVIGGKRANFDGAMPGIIEEVLFSLKRRQPIYLAGGFGGATLDILRALHPEIAAWLPPFVDEPDLDNDLTNGLSQIIEVATNQKWDGSDNGLNEMENRLLAASYRPSEIAALIGRGLGRLSM